MADLNLSSVRLPPAFQECEYIESTGTQRIDTGLALNTSLYSFVFDLIPTYFSGNYSGIMGANFSPQVGFNASGWNNGSAISASPYKPTTGVKYHIEYSKNGSGDYWVDGFDTGLRRSGTMTCNYFWIESMSDNAKVRLLSASIIQLSDATKILDFVPCYLKQAWNNIPAGTIGLYDLCGSLSSNGTPFYTNAGTGTFAKGPDVVHADTITINGADVDRLTDANGMAWTKHGLMLPSAFQRCEYIESHGTEYIDTQIIPSAQHIYELSVEVVSGTNNCFFGNLQFDSDSKGVCLARASTSILAVNMAGGWNNINFSFEEGRTYKLKIEADQNQCQFFADGALAKQVSKALQTGTASLFIGRNNGSNFNPATIRYRAFLSAKLDGTAEGSFIPVYLKTAWNNIPAGTIGLYDLCGSICPLTNTPFYINAGTGEFTKGADVV